jgi:hypothetical protein
MMMNNRTINQMQYWVLIISNKFFVFVLTALKQVTFFQGHDTVEQDGFYLSPSWNRASLLKASFMDWAERLKALEMLKMWQRAGVS